MNLQDETQRLEPVKLKEIVQNERGILMAARVFALAADEGLLPASSSKYYVPLKLLLLELLSNIFLSIYNLYHSIYKLLNIF